ncbi:hypothetical protein GQR36_19845 [Enterococcus termitis]
MTINSDTQQKIKQFSKEQAELYLNDAEMTYMEKLRRKAGKNREKVGQKLARFKNTSDKGQEIQDDMILYMNDYITDLIAGGMQEQEALKKRVQSFDLPAKQINRTNCRNALHNTMQRWILPTMK